MFLMGLAARADQVLAQPSVSATGPASWLTMLAVERGTVTAAPDFAYRLAAAVPYPEHLDLSGVRMSISGGERLNWQTLLDFQATAEPMGLRWEVITPGYGLAEATVGVSNAPAGRGPVLGPGGHVGAGRLMPGVELVVADGLDPGPLAARRALAVRRLPHPGRLRAGSRWRVARYRRRRVRPRWRALRRRPPGRGPEFGRAERVRRRCRVGDPRRLRSAPARLRRVPFRDAAGPVRPGGGSQPEAGPYRRGGRRARSLHPGFGCRHTAHPARASASDSPRRDPAHHFGQSPARSLPLAHRERQDKQPSTRRTELTASPGQLRSAPPSALRPPPRASPPPRRRSGTDGGQSAPPCRQSIEDGRISSPLAILCSSPHLCVAAAYV
jgi:AMP-binding enzyme